MEIQTITRYKFDGKEYPDLMAVKTEVENRIGAIIDKIDVRLTPSQALNLLKIVTEDKDQLRKLLDVTFTIEGERFNQDQDKNILDL